MQRQSVKAFDGLPLDRGRFTGCLFYIIYVITLLALCFQHATSHSFLVPLPRWSPFPILTHLIFSSIKPSWREYPAAPLRDAAKAAFAEIWEDQVSEYVR